MTQLYLAYGSNLHHIRLIERVPSARLIGNTRLDRYQVAFNKRSSDGSSKCNLMYTGDDEHTAYAAVYEIKAREKLKLDAIEGLGKGYDEHKLQVLVNGDTLTVFAYISAGVHLVMGLAPYDWYHSLVIAGATYHKFPTRYVNVLRAVPTQPDMDLERRAKHERLLAKM